MTMWTVKEQYARHDEILKERIHCLMPQLMKECGVEMWVVISREYNEDPVFPTLVPSLVKNASRTTCLVFCLDGEGNYEALNVSRPNPRFDGFYTQAMNRRDDVFEALNHLIARKKPSRVHVDISNECAIADGLSKNLYDHLQRPCYYHCYRKTDNTELLSEQDIIYYYSDVGDQTDYRRYVVFAVALQYPDE